VSLVLASIALSISFVVSVSLILIIWLQDGIWKTFQARSEARLLELERAYAEVKSSGEKECTLIGFQLNNEFLLNRPSVAKLLRQYLIQSVRPTVAYPHVILVLVLFFYHVS